MRLTRRIKEVLLAAIFILVVVVLASLIQLGLCSMFGLQTSYADEDLSVNDVGTKPEHFSYEGDFDWSQYVRDYEGCKNAAEWLDKLKANRVEYKEMAENVPGEYEKFISEEQKAELSTIAASCVSLHTLGELEEKKNQIQSIKDALQEEKEEYEAEQARIAAEKAAAAQSSTYYSGGNGSGLTKQGGVNNHNGRKETYYSSRILYHYKTPEWTLDSEGFYHDSQGRYVVAASDKPRGSTFMGSKGECVVLDTGCATGVTDYYVNW